uniref:Transposase n=1 Tax=Candidatus Kentrum sp. TUN TaxID=2126343 RepID=A0A450ZJ88_9GAMM|nr:MAG: hypothetical protein BECKTUN1418F_GA0071002_10298 [Candidatus Kentron sp. TUN]VFK55340.1 MAG: hypothetical protein BECKTUN1418E_GA0071001_102816 [Candidatus Kentron sp. TUN]
MSALRAATERGGQPYPMGSVRIFVFPIPKKQYVDQAPNWRERETAFRGRDLLLCEVCGKVMRFVSSRIPIPLWRVEERLQAAFS